MALDREDTLKKAEKLLRQGRLDAAIAEYVRVVEDQPRDWTTANALGDLYARAGQAERAVAQYARIADHFLEAGFYPKAAALCKKILKLRPDDEPTQLKLAELSAQQGLLADARGHLNAVLTRRRSRGDARGVDEIVIRLGDLDPGDVDARVAAAKVLAAQGNTAAAAAIYRALYAALVEKGRDDQARAALREAARLDPDDLDARTTLALEAIEAGSPEDARTYLDRRTAGSDPRLLLVLVELELRAGQTEAARDLLPELLALDPAARSRVVELGRTLAADSPDAAFACIDAAVDASAAAKDFEEAAAALQAFAARAPGYVPALLKLVEICVDGGLESAMYDAQAQLADAYLTAGQAAEARVIAEDLVAREPWERTHIERFRRALVMLRIPEPDSVIAERLSGQSPFTATDLFGHGPGNGEAGPTPDAGPSPLDSAIPPDTPAPPEERPGPPAPPAPPPPDSRPPERGGVVEIDLTGALSALQRTPSAPGPEPLPAPPSLEAVFEGFRGAAAAPLDPEEARQHLELARTYVELGMPEEALSCLEIAARAPLHRFAAAALLGRLYRDQGDVPRAVEWLERAAEAPAPDPEQAWALLYDLGVLLEVIGESARALAVFLELQAEAGGYRDVAARAERLARVQTGG